MLRYHSKIRFWKTTCKKNEIHVSCRMWMDQNKYRYYLTPFERGHEKAKNGLSRRLV